MLDSQGSRPNFRCGQEVKHENLMSQDLDPSHGWKYRRLCSVTPLTLLAIIISSLRGLDTRIHITRDIYWINSDNCYGHIM